MRFTFIVLLFSVLLASLYSELHNERGLLTTRSRLPSSFTATLTTANYFANKRNIFNQWFVKQGWGWTTSAAIVYLGSAQWDTMTTKDGKAMTKVGLNLVGSLKKWFIASVYWYYLTQATWFIVGSGASVSHYLLTASGGKCTDYSTKKIVEGDCRGAGLYFENGHDVSGHVFLLSFASLLLVTVISPSLPLLYHSIFDRSSTDIRRDRILSLPHTFAVRPAYSGHLAALADAFWHSKNRPV